MKFFYLALLGVLFGVGLFAAFESVEAQVCPVSNCVAGPCTGETEENANLSCQLETGAAGVCCLPAGSTDGGGSDSSSGSDFFPNPFGEIDTLEELLLRILFWFQAVVVTLALIFLILGAINYIISGGSEVVITRAKKMMLAAAIGLAIAIAAPTFLREITQLLGLVSTDVDDSVVQAAPSILDILFSILKFLLGIFGVLALIMLIIGGIMFITGGGSERQVDRAKRMITWAVVGIVVGFGSLVIIGQIARFFE